MDPRTERILSVYVRKVKSVARVTAIDRIRRIVVVRIDFGAPRLQTFGGDVQELCAPAQKDATRSVADVGTSDDRVL